MSKQARDVGGPSHVDGLVSCPLQPPVAAPVSTLLSVSALCLEVLMYGWEPTSFWHSQCGHIILKRQLDMSHKLTKPARLPGSASC